MPEDLFPSASIEEVEDVSSTSVPPVLPCLNADAAEWGLRLVVRNSFIELVEDEPQLPTIRRRRSAYAILETNEPPQKALSQAEPAEAAPGSESQSTDEGSCPRSEAGTDSDTDDASGECRATLMIRNLPLDYTRDLLISQLDGVGFSGKYSFVYVPFDFSLRRGLGYALVSTCSRRSAKELSECLCGIRPVGSAPEDEPCAASWSEPCRTLEEHIERYRNSPVMHERMPDEIKPAIFANGQRIAFPPPTKPIRLPRIRHVKGTTTGNPAGDAAGVRAAAAARKA